MYAAQSPPSLDSPAAQSAFAVAMLDPAAYAALQAVAAPIHRIETHISWVFLTGDFAYKIKRPVRLSFVDYSTPELRVAACREEVRLNQRHAPGLYLDVVPITGTPDAPRVGDIQGAPFEHAVRMQQFDTSQELSQLLQGGTVTAQECAELGARIATMHAEAAHADTRTTYGAPDAVHRTTLDNFTEIGNVLQAAVVTAQLQRLQTHLQRLFDQSRALMTERRGEGHVREGHGDLHCGNVVRWRGRLVAFDGLEFDPALRHIDVASDIAFLTMDLSVHGRDDLRRATLQAWLAATGDCGALALLPYFEGYRALVRAKVAALRGSQMTDGASGSVTLAHRYLDWATSRTSKPAPRLVVMTGLSGSGKTWLAERIASDSDALVVRSDVERKRLAGMQPLQSSASAPDAGLYSLDFNQRTYDRLRTCVERCLQGGASIIVDAANLRRDERSRFLAIARVHSAKAMVVHCTAPLDVLRRRVAARAAGGSDASEATVDLLDRQPSYWEAFGNDELDHVVTVDTTAPESIARALRAVQGR